MMSANTAALPPSMAAFAEAFGLGAALQLMQLYGGQDVLFTKQPKPEMIDAFGEDRAEEINGFFNAQQIYIPNGKPAKLLDEVKRLQKSNVDQHEIARQLGISNRHVRRLSPAAPKPMPLFPNLNEET